ncbi:MAG: hypothetical protein IKR48_13395 [Kiritimatiellae bacterium]|nr:hypothetical protein [Kiritimatiellia bacterium]
MNRIGIIGMSLCLAWTAQARTIALWPLNWDAVNSTVDGRCAINAANNLSGDASLVYNGGIDSGLGWTKPRNLVSTDTYLFEPAITSVVYSAGTAAAKNFAYSTTVGKYVTGTNNFTLEGWIRIPKFPESGQLFFIADSDGVNGASGNQRWFLTLRNNSKFSGVTWQLCPLVHSGSDTLLYTLSESEQRTLMCGWHHWALSLEQTPTNCMWRFYQDGKQLKTLTYSTIATAKPSGYFGLGCRNNTGNVFKGALAYCRLSDEVLTPDQFLFAPTQTQGHWKLDRIDNETVNGAPSVGESHITGGILTYPYGNTYSDSTIYPDSDCAFTGNPPNPTVTLPNGNVGSFFGRRPDTPTTMRINNIGYDLSLTNDFTCEGWVKIEQRDLLVRRTPHILGTKLNENNSQEGWGFMLSGSAENLEAKLVVDDSAGRIVNLQTVANLAGRMGEWFHLALVYNHTAGENSQGVWTGYVNGEFSGCVTNSVVPRSGGVEWGKFKFMSLLNTDVDTFAGKLDCWRISKAALRPTQFLCASEGAEAADAVLALWPMNAANGIYLDGADVVGNYTFETLRNANCRVTACDGAPEIPGVSTPTNGCTGFRVSDETPRAYLFLHQSPAVDSLFGAAGSTFETYVRRTAEPVSGNNEFIFLACHNDVIFTQNKIGTQRANLTYRTNGFWLYCSIQSGDKQFLDNGNPILLETGVWTHLALTYEQTANGHEFNLYLNGVKRGTVSYTSGTPVSPKVLWIGGRPISDNSFRGEFSNLRISRGVLSPSEFLCAAANTKRTISYWPLDSEGGTIDLSGRIPGIYGCQDLSDSSAVSGLARGIRAEVPNPDTSANFQGLPLCNAGAVALASGGYARTPLLGEQLDVTAPFTVEGWIKWSRSLGAEKEVIAGTYNVAVDGGWKLVLDSTGETPTLRIFAKGPTPVRTLADGVLLADASILYNVWTHLALRYDPSEGNGIWTLFVNGKPVGSVGNLYRNSNCLYQGSFRLGASSGDTSFVGGFDLWRASRGLLDEEDLLYRYYGGMSILLR